MKILVAFSGGKDSHASLIWAIKEFGARNVTAIFCDTGWEHPLTYSHVADTAQINGIRLVTLRNARYRGLVDLAKKKGRFPSAKARFCTEELKSKPMIDYVLDQKEFLVVIQGIRAQESSARSKLKSTCSFFRFYKEPYRIDGRGRKRRYTYRANDVARFCAKYGDPDVLRPVFDWTGLQVIEYITKAGQTPNPLYSQGMKRVGCFPCVMCSNTELRAIERFHPEQIDRIRHAESTVGSSFFAPNRVPGRPIASIDQVINHVTNGNEDELFGLPNCMSFYGLCETAEGNQ